jgi:ABC-type branched-subunit amino acid transport system substrate-binding protein
MEKTLTRERRTPRVRMGGVAIIVCALVIGIAACSSSNSPGNGNGAGSTITVGMFEQLNGVGSAFGGEEVAIVKKLFSQVNQQGGIDGHMLNVVAENETQDASTAISAAKNFASQGAHLIIGYAQSSDCVATAPYFDSLNETLFGSCEVSQMVGPNRLAKNFYETLYTVEANSHFQGTLLAKLYPHVTKIDLLLSNYNFSYQYADGVLAGMKAAGANVSFGLQFYVPLTEETYISQISKIEDSTHGQSTGLLFLPPADPTFLQEAVSVGLPSRLAFMATGGAYVEESRSLPGTQPQVWETSNYGVPELFQDPAEHDYNAALNNSFNATVRQLTGYPVNETEQSVYVAAEAIIDGLKKDGGNPNPQPFQAAVNGLNIPVPTGTAYVNPTTHVIDQPLVGYETVGDPTADQHLKLLQGYSVPQQFTGISFTGTKADIQQIYPPSSS